VAGYQYRVSGDAGANWTAAADGGSRTIAANGLSYVEFRAVDGAGNVSAWTDPSAQGEANITAAAASVSHVVWIVMENSDYSQIVDSANAPYLNSLAHTYGLAANMDAVAHPSLPNYIAMTSGGTQGVIDDGNPSQYPLSVPSIFSQLGTNWKSLAESMPSNCATTDSGTYAARHNPATFYTNIAAQCAAQDTPLGATPDISSAFTFIAPNLCDDTHDCSDATGDTWLSNFIPQLLATPQYQSGSTAVFITWDENDSYAPGNQIPTIVISPTTHSVKSMTAFTHYSLLRTTEELLGLPLLGAAQQANSMSSAFNLP
jgi:hypothetical protein